MAANAGYLGEALKKNLPVSNQASQRRKAAQLAVDHRPLSAAQTRLQSMADASQRTMQLRSLHALADGRVIQKKALDRNKLNVAGESHPESGPRRAKEKQYTEAMTGGIYKTEGEFKVSSSVFATERLGDPMLLRAEMLLAILKEKTLPAHLTPFSTGSVPAGFPNGVPVADLWDIFKGEFKKQLDEIAAALLAALDEKAEQTQALKAENTCSALVALSGSLPSSPVAAVGPTIIPAVARIISTYATDVLGAGDIRPEATINTLRSTAMQGAAADNAARWVGEQKGVWKVGQDHIAEIAGGRAGGGYELMTKDEFNADFQPWLRNNP